MKKVISILLLSLMFLSCTEEEEISYIEELIDVKFNIQDNLIKFDDKEWVDGSNNEDITYTIDPYNKLLIIDSRSHILHGIVRSDLTPSYHLCNNTLIVSIESILEQGIDAFIVEVALSIRDGPL